MTPPLDTNKDMNELNNILDDLAQAVEWCIGIPGAVRVDRKRELEAIKTAHSKIQEYITEQVRLELEEVHCRFYRDGTQPEALTYIADRIAQLKDTTIKENP